jgi:membrane protein DedA with SNARE-associated domain
MTPAQLSTLVAHYGYLATFVAVMLASSGIPVPAGELLIAAAIYAANTHRLSLPDLLLVGSAGALVGGAAGYAIGRLLGAAALQRYGRFVGLNAAKLRLGRYLFLVHGGKIVFSLRFVALVGPFGGVLAGANRMAIGRFMVFNALGAVAWTIVFGAGGYLFGAMFEAVGRTAGIAAVLITLALVGSLALYIHRRGAELQAKADALLGVDD